MTRHFALDTGGGTVTLRAFHGAQREVVVPDGVEVIGADAFLGKSRLESVLLPDSVREIGPRAFQNCDALRSLTIPGGVAVIGREAFHNCNALRELTLNEGLRAIHARAFWYCHSLRRVSVPRSVTLIGSRAFECCSLLAEVELRGTGVFIDEYAFNETPYCHRLLREAERCMPGRAGTGAAPEHLVLPEGHTHIDIWAFSRSGIRSAWLPSSLRTIGMCAFKGCENLREVSMSPNTYCTYNGRLAADDGIFAGCRSLEQVTFRGALKNFTWHDAQAPQFLRGFDHERTFHGCVRLRRIVAPDVPLSAVPPPWRQYAVNGYLAAAERARLYTRAVARQYDELLLADPRGLLDRTAADHTYPLHQYLMEHRLITAESFAAVLERAGAVGAAEVMAALLSYQNTVLGGSLQRLDSALLDWDTP